MILKSIATASSIMLCLLLMMNHGRAQDSFAEKHILVSLRMIGHQLLLNAGDSTSRVMPIVEENDQYRITFEANFGISPEKLVRQVDQVMKDQNIAIRYILEVQQCETGETAYSFEMDNLTHKVLIHCQYRNLPKSCYSLLFTFSGEVETDYSISEKSGKEVIETKYVAISMVTLVFVLSFIIFRRRNRSKLDPNRIKLGRFYFDRRSTMLIMEEQRTELTSKEADLLLILYESVNSTVNKEVLLNKVWGDEGDYIGRTLDVFISKLRKKFEADPNVRIVNVRGVGYKLVIDE